ncbi:hypothetical protein AtNW77_Chr3g0206371 [Arabidopsis thaliana]
MVITLSNDQRKGFYDYDRVILIMMATNVGLVKLAQYIYYIIVVVVEPRFHPFVKALVTCSVIFLGILGVYPVWFVVLDCKL